MRHIGAVAILVMAMAVGVGGCSQENSVARASPEAAASTSTAPGASAEPLATDKLDQALDDAIDEVVLSLRNQDRDRLRDGTGDRLRDRIQDRDLDRLMACMPERADIDIVAREVAIDGDLATVTITFAITVDGESSEVERTWIFEQAADGAWVLAELPTCPFAE